MTNRASVLWKILKGLAKKWPEVVAKLTIITTHLGESVFRKIQNSNLNFYVLAWNSKIDATKGYTMQHVVGGRCLLFCKDCRHYLPKIYLLWSSGDRYIEYVPFVHSAMVLGLQNHLHNNKLCILSKCKIVS